MTPLFSDLPIRATKARCLHYSKLNNSVPTIIRFYSSHWSCAGLSSLDAAASPIGLSKSAEGRVPQSSELPRTAPHASSYYLSIFLLFIIPIVVAIADSCSHSRSRSQSLASSKFDFHFSYSIHSVSICPFIIAGHTVRHSQLVTLSTTGSWLSGLFSPFCQHLPSPSPLSSPSLSHPPFLLPPSLLILTFLPWHLHLDRLFSATSCITHRLHHPRPFHLGRPTLVTRARRL